jgi:hypothetical protein
MGGKQVLAAGAAREGPGWADTESYGCFYFSANRSPTDFTSPQGMKLGTSYLAYSAMGGKAYNQQALFVFLNLAFIFFLAPHQRRLQPISCATMLILVNLNRCTVAPGEFSGGSHPIPRRNHAEEFA